MRQPRLTNEELLAIAAIAKLNPGLSNLGLAWEIRNTLGRDVHPGNLSRIFARAEAAKAARQAPKSPSPTDLETTLAIPDTHVPFHDHRAWNTVLAVAAALRPTRIVILGDFVDCWTVSSYPKSPNRRALLSDEIDATNAELDALQSASPDSLYDYCEGNHEERLERYLCDKAPHLYGLISMRDLLRIPARGWHWVPYYDHVEHGEMSYTHDVGRCGVNAGRQSLADFADNIVFGHTHGASVTYSGDVRGKRHVSVNCGWLGDPTKITYRHKARVMRESQHGFGWFESTPDGVTWANFVPIIHGRAVVRGKVISA